MLSCSIENTGIFLCLFIDGNGDTVGERLRERCRLGELPRFELLRTERLRPERCGFVVGSIAAIYVILLFYFTRFITSAFSTILFCSCSSSSTNIFIIYAICISNFKVDHC